MRHPCGQDDAGRQAMPPANEFICTIEYCSILYDGDRFTVKFRTGLHLLGVLLREPGRPFHVCELFAAVHPVDPVMLGSTTGLGLRRNMLWVEGALGPLLDPKAKHAYWEELVSLQEELEHAEECNDFGRADSLRKQIEFVRRELSGAIGLGGKDRPVCDPVERIRQKVRKNLSAAFEALGEAHAAFSWHLRAHVKTGRVCRYVPNPTQPARWKVSLPERALAKGV
jgi:hypothetical protein